MSFQKYRVWDETKKQYYTGDFSLSESGEFLYAGWRESGNYEGLILQRYTTLKDREYCEAADGDIIDITYYSLDTDEKISFEELVEERKMDAQEHASVVGLTLDPDSDFSWPYLEPGKYKISDQGYYFLLEAEGWIGDDVLMSPDFFRDERLGFNIVGGVKEES